MLNKRCKNLVAAMGSDFQAAIFKTQPNMFYFLDFDTEGAGTLVLLPEKAVLIIDSRYIEVAKTQVKDFDVVLETNAHEQAKELLVSANVSKVLTEDKVTVSLFKTMKEKLDGIELSASKTLSDAAEVLRAIKDDEEIRRMKEAQRVTDACFVHILPFIKEGVSEIDIMLEMEHFMRSKGAEKVAFDTICVSDPKTSLPHGVPGSNKVKNGCFITMDFGAKVKGYCADMTRTVAFGNISKEHEDVYSTVLKAHLAGIAAAKAGVIGSAVDKVARDIISKAGYGEFFGHGLGHAVGIEIHENPRFSPMCHDKVKAGMMVTVEPGIYLPGKFGCRIEDTVLIKENGCEPLPKSDKNLIRLG